MRDEYRNLFENIKSVDTLGKCDSLSTNHKTNSKFNITTSNGYRYNYNNVEDNGLEIEEIKLFKLSV